MAARIVDTPCNEMNTDHFLDVSENTSLFGYFQIVTAVTLMQPTHRHLSLFQEIRAVGTELGITPVIIRGEELKQRGFGGTETVGVAHILALILFTLL